MSEGGLLATHAALVAKGALVADAAQTRATRQLHALQESLSVHMRAPRVGLPGFRRRRAPPKGIYMWGGVGRGKSMLMDMFFDTAPVPRKRRVHFHAFMTDVHERIHAWRARGGGDPIPPVARALAREAKLLCFDEFQVEDIADASILGRLFTALFDEKTIAVATSNTEPDALYEGGLHRARFMPFIALLHETMHSVALDGETDYRRQRRAGEKVYYLISEGDTAPLDTAFARLTGGAPLRACAVEVKGRTIPVPAQALGVARFAFDNLCAKPLGASDYLALARRFHTIFVEGIPQMPPEKRNEAKRFIALIDAFYETGVMLVASAHVLPDALYPRGTGAKAFQRTVSRLVEMQSEDWPGAKARVLGKSWGVRGDESPRTNLFKGHGGL